MTHTRPLNDVRGFPEPGACSSPAVSRLSSVVSSLPTVRLSDLLPADPMGPHL